ncbi:MAG: tetratricopeptide repeat protein [Frankiaceae bacterium]
MARQLLPEGVVTFLFTDIEGSTKLLDRLGDAYAAVLATHHRLMRGCILEHGGQEVDTEGDAFFVAFSSPREAVAAAADAQRALQAHPWPHGDPVLVRMGLHTGEPLLIDGNYVGMDVHRAARICSAAHGGQVLVSARLHDLVADRTTDGVTFLDLGEHHLKDIPEPQRLLQLCIDGLPNEFPPLRALRPPTNLPHRAGAVVGRQAEMADLLALLRSGVRLVTVTGPGGVGKTRFTGAVAAAATDDFPSGTFFVDLSRVRDGDRVLPEVARVLRVSLERLESAGQTLAEHIRDQRMLLVLDNFEQVLDGGRAVAGLLESCPGLRVLVTSRLRLDLQDEHEYALDPLRQAEAVELFVARAQMARRGFRLTESNSAAVAQVCALLDGLPLAIELAAARTRLFPPQGLLGRLSDRFRLLTGGGQDLPERHRALRATVDWSYNLLQEDERRLFRDLAVFDGGARYESIEAVATPGTDVLDLLTGLVNHSLVRQGPDPDGEFRFSMLKTLQEYAGDLLEGDPAHRTRLRERHAQHYLDVAEESSGHEAGTPALEGVELEHDNMRAALGFWLARKEVGPDAGLRALRLASAMGGYWYQHGMAAEGKAWLERALAAAPDPPLPVEAQALRTLGVMAEQRSEFGRATEILEHALGLFEKLGDLPGEARSLNSLGVVARSAGRPEEAERYFSRSAAIREELGDAEGVTTTLSNLGVVYLDQGRWAEAQPLFAETLARDQAANNSWGTACSMLNLAVSQLIGGQVDVAQPAIRAAIVAFGEVDDPDGVIEAMEATVGVAVARRQWITAGRLAGATDAARRSLDIPGRPADRIHLERWLAKCRDALGAEAFEAAQKEGAVMTYEQARAYALHEIAPAGA